MEMCERSQSEPVSTGAAAETQPPGAPRKRSTKSRSRASSARRSPNRAFAKRCTTLRPVPARASRRQVVTRDEASPAMTRMGTRNTAGQGSIPGPLA